MFSRCRGAHRPRGAHPGPNPPPPWELGSRAAPVAAAMCHVRCSPMFRPASPVGRAGLLGPGPDSDGPDGVAPRIPSRRPRNVVQARPRRTTRMELRSPRSSHRRWRSSGVNLDAMVGSPSWGSGTGRPASPPARSTRSAAACLDQFGAQRRQVGVLADGHHATARRPGPVSSPSSSFMRQTPVSLVSGEDRPLDRRRAPPAGQEREMQVDHGDAVEQGHRE